VTARHDFWNISLSAMAMTTWLFGDHQLLTDVPVVRDALAQAYGESALPAPSSLQAVVQGATVMLSWVNPAAVLIALQLEVGSGPGLSNLYVATMPAASTQLTVADVPAGTYFVRLRAIGPAGRSAPSNEVTVTVGGCQTPGAPSPPAFTLVAPGTVRLSWSAVAGAQSYVIEAGSSPGAADLAILDTGSSQPLLQASAPPGVYYVRVRARNACGVGPASSEAIVTVP
jgi:hypothetical protein